MKKIITIILSLMLFVNLLFSQSLVELAKKEKERRAKLKGKKVVVVTNVDLRNLRKRPALTIIEPAYYYVEEAIPSFPIETIDREDLEEQARLAANWNKANENANLLTLRMNELQQRFFSFENWFDRAEMQRQIFETFQKLEKAREEAEITKKELDRKRTKKRR